MVCGGLWTAAGQAPQCTEGTLANVLGTSCSVGDLTFSFQNTFLGVLDVTEQGTTTPFTIDPSEIGFMPVRRDGRVGFQLTTNFVDGPGPDSTFDASRLVQFSYTPQANPGFDIVEQVLVLDASAQAPSASSVFVQVLDFQTYPNTPSILTDLGSFLVEQNGVVNSGLVSHAYLEVPALLSTGFLPGANTTQLQTITIGPAQTEARSVKFLYRTGPAALPPAAALTYENIDLPGAATTFVSGIANNGRITGAYRDSQGVLHGYLTDPRGGFTTIDFPGATSTSGNGLNDRGDVVGSYTDATGAAHGFLLRDNNFTAIDFPNATFTSAFAVDDLGQVVGVYETSDQGVHGFLLDHDQFTSIDHNPQTPGVTGPPFTEVFGINNSGEIVGVFFDPFTFRGLVQQEDIVHPLDVPGQTDTNNDFLNDQGDVVGFFSDINQVLHGFRRQGGLFTTVDFPGGSSNFPLGINAEGKIVGQYSDTAGSFHSYLAQPGSIQDGELAPALLVNGNILPASSPSVPVRVCGSAEWRQHVEQIKLPCAMKR